MQMTRYANMKAGGGGDDWNPEPTGDNWNGGADTNVGDAAGQSWGAGDEAGAGGDGGDQACRM